jgi:hypothetical protein
VKHVITSPHLGRVMGLVVALLLLTGPAAVASPVPLENGRGAYQVAHLNDEGALVTTIAWAGYSVEVPRAFRQRSVTNCYNDKGSLVIVGSYQDLQECMGLFGMTGTTVLLGYGGPPLPPIPTVFSGDVSYHGVEVQLLTGGEELRPGVPFSTSYLLALLPGRATWLYMGSPGGVLSKALTEARRILATLRMAGPGKAPTSRPPLGSFVGTWGVHDAQLRITSLRSGVLFAQGDCLCEEYDTLTLSPSATGTELNATVGAVRAIGAGGKRVPDPHPNYVVGQRSFFEFAEPHLMLQLVVPNEPGDMLSSSFGNPYWCGIGLASRFENACGL